MQYQKVILTKKNQIGKQIPVHTKKLPILTRQNAGSLILLPVL